MKQQLPIPTKYLIPIFGFFLVIVIIIASMFSKNYLSNKAKINALVGQQINGVIQLMKDEGRGAYFLAIKTKTDTLRIHSLPLGYEVENCNIKVGDSISKNANSRIINFYKFKNNLPEKYCEFTM